MSGARRSRWIVGGVVLLVLLGLGLVARRAFVFPDDLVCQNLVLSEVASPDGRAKVVVFQRDCGATTGFNTQASIIEIGKPLPNDAGGNVFVADTGHGAAPAGLGGGPQLRVRWLDPRRVKLTYHPRAHVYKAETRQGAIEVLLEQSP